MECLLRYTLIGDGSSDKALLNIIKWLLDDLYPALPNKGTYADFRNLIKPPRKDDVLSQIETAGMYYPFDVLFYHRDAEKADKNIISIRKSEVLDKVGAELNIVCVVPIVMMESWLLFDESAIKKAAGNRNYRGKINLPSIKKIERESQTKEILHNILRECSGLKNRQLNKFNVHKAVHIVSENIQDFSPLRQLHAFNTLEMDVKHAVNSFLKKAS